MPTSSKTSSSPASAIADALAASMSTVVWLDLDLNDADAAALLKNDPPIYAEYDVVRSQWAFRLARPEELAAPPEPAAA